jgi:hypothetical protein
MPCACHRPAAEVAAPQDVTPGARVVPTSGRAGWPLAIVYRWWTGPTFRGFDRPPRAFVYVLAEDGATLIGDDHLPEPLPETWTASTTYTYTRVIFPPEQFPGRVELQIGLFDPESGQRLALHGDDAGQTAYRVAAATLLPHAPERPARFGKGFFPPVAGPGRPFTSTRWTDREAQVSMPNPMADALLFVHAATDPKTFAQPPILTLELESARIGRPYEIHSDEPFTLVVRVGKAMLGQGERCDLRLVMSDTFRSHYDPRTLALEVYDLILLPIEGLPPELVALAQR